MSIRKFFHSDERKLPWPFAVRYSKKKKQVIVHLLISFFPHRRRYSQLVRSFPFKTQWQNRFEVAAIFPIDTVQ
ncbi:hypothetical protein H6P81_003796 [Aristolochia fimbriata]|uniref:Uncharacterized protein n=1 Tax=Aristolochia fimbriata TaxID=158543 RepID=A0AAV7FHG4_ARIFI|nr:hypothetical protein H6P81_003796 [Aristolochia fimbriata]